MEYINERNEIKGCFESTAMLSRDFQKNKEKATLHFEKEIET